ncbi:MAG: hypothetical protein K9H16_04455 [Bacteroidales bacterium]|nr:hypothetical protein [Bacteroidales bacterium]
MDKLKDAFKVINFKWLPKHINHIAEGIVFNKRNVSFLAINALFRTGSFKVARSPEPFKNSFFISGFVPLQANDRLRSRAEELTVIFRTDEHLNIIVITAYSENDET